MSAVLVLLTTLSALTAELAESCPGNDKFGGRCGHGEKCPFGFVCTPNRLCCPCMHGQSQDTTTKAPTRLYKPGFCKFGHCDAPDLMCEPGSVSCCYRMPLAAWKGEKSSSSSKKSDKSEDEAVVDPHFDAVRIRPRQNPLKKQPYEQLVDQDLIRSVSSDITAMAAEQHAAAAASSHPVPASRVTPPIIVVEVDPNAKPRDIEDFLEPPEVQPDLFRIRPHSKQQLEKPIDQIFARRRLL